MFELETIGAWAWLIPAFTAAAFVINVVIVATGRSGRLAARVTVLATAASTVVALAVLAAALGAGGEHLAHEPFVRQIAWAPMGVQDGALNVGVMIDPLSAATVAMVTFVCLMIFVFSTAYMGGEFGAYRDPRTGEVDRDLGNARYGRFFAFVALFATGMLGFVLSSNLLEALVFWEIMGLCSFLLIGFWYYKPSAAAASIKAFLTTRVGDIFFLAGVLVLYGIFGTVDFYAPHDGVALLSGDSVLRLRELGSVPGTSLPWASLIALLVFGGAVGKSAQFPLHVWLPDAMEGPTPVSALIHAATMVAAGVFLVARMYPLFSANSVDSPGDISGAMFVVAAVGAFTALFAATIGVAQFDIKRVLAYSTVSQLGYMIMALGIGAYVAAVFHLITHAFFKGLLFLGSGSVIHGIEHGHHHAEDHAEDGGPKEDLGGHTPAPGWIADVKDAAQDMRNMGGLRERMPFTFLAFLAGTLALTGIPVFAGFWSKDEILAEAFHKAFHEGIFDGVAIAGFVWVLGTLGAFLTAFYMARQVFMVFGGKPQTEAAQHAPEGEPAMVYPLLVLAFFATFLGFVAVPETLPGLGGLLGNNPFHRFMGAVTATGAHFPPLDFNALPALISIVMAVSGWGLGWWLYGRAPEEARAHDPLQRLGLLWVVVNRKYFIDEIYTATVIRASIMFSQLNARFDATAVDGLVNLAGLVGEGFSRVNGWVDNNIVDGAVNLVAHVHTELSRGLRLLQSGRVQQYLMVVFLGLLFLVGAYVF